MPVQLDKSEAHNLIDGLPQGATWEDLLYEIYVRREVEAGVHDADKGRVVSVAEVCRRLGLSS